MIRYKNTSIHVARRSFYLKLVHIKHLSRQFHWNRSVMSNIYVTALLRAYKRYFFHREGISVELFLVTWLLVNKLQQRLVTIHNSTTKVLNTSIMDGNTYPTVNSIQERSLSLPFPPIHKPIHWKFRFYWLSLLHHNPDISVQCLNQVTRYSGDGFAHFPTSFGKFRGSASDKNTNTSSYILVN